MNVGAYKAVGAADELALGDHVSDGDGQLCGGSDMLLEWDIARMGYRKIYEFQVFGNVFMSGRMDATAET